MDLSNFGLKFGSECGILELMDDLGQAMQGRGARYMLGGGNPAHIPEVNARWRERMRDILQKGDEFERMLANYDTPQGKGSFLDAIAALLNKSYGWPLSTENIAVCTGSQSAFFMLLNMFSGRAKDGRSKRILFPLCPEYIGYADQALDDTAFLTHEADIEYLGGHLFKYHVDFNELNVGDDIGAICVSRPTNPSGNVLTDGEIRRLAEIAGNRGIPLLLDNAYGAPFPGIIFTDVKPVWNQNIVCVMSLSKLGLPAARTGIIIAVPEIIRTICACNAVLTLANGSIGQVITEPMLRSGELLSFCRKHITPYYKEKTDAALAWMQECFAERFPYRVHKNEGTFFLWLWFEDLPVSCRELYRRLKNRGVVVVPGNYFFYGLEKESKHSRECIRINVGQDSEMVRRGLEIIAEVVEDVWKNAGA